MLPITAYCQAAARSCTGRSCLRSRILQRWKKAYIYSSSKKAIESVNITDFMATLNQLFFRPKNLFPLFDIIDMLGEICRLLVRMDLSLDQEEVPLDYLSGQIHYAIENALSLDALKSAISEPVSYIFENIHKAVQAQNTRPIRMVLKYIEEHYTDPIRLEDAALLVTLNPAYLSNIFKKETGENFVDYLNSYRIGQARELLKDSNLSINEIAYSTGFQDARYFSKLFKKIRRHHTEGLPKNIQLTCKGKERL